MRPCLLRCDLSGKGLAGAQSDMLGGTLETGGARHFVALALTALDSGILLLVG